MQLTMLKESFFFLCSYKYEHFKRNFFCGTNIEGGVEDVAFPVFGFCQDHSNTFSALLNILRPPLTRQNTHLRDCVTPEKLLALGLYRLAHGNSYITIGPNFNVGKSTVIEAVQDVVEALCDLRNEYIKFPSTKREVLAT